MGAVHAIKNGKPLLDLYIRVLDDTFMTAIYYKVDCLDFDVVS